MALLRSETEAKLGQPPHRGSLLRLVPKEINPLQDPQRQLFYDSMRLVSRRRGIRLVMAIPTEGEITGPKLAEAVFGQTQPANPRSKLRELIESGLSQYVEEGTAKTSNQKTYKLNDQGIILHKAAEIITSILEGNPDLPFMFGEDRNNEIPSYVIRTEIIFALARAGDKGYRQADLARQINGSRDSSISNAFAALKAAGMIEISRDGTAMLSYMGKKLAGELLLPIAEITGYPEERLEQIEQIMGFALLKEKKQLTPEEKHKRELISMIKSAQLSDLQRQEAWSELLQIETDFLKWLVSVRKGKFPAADVDELRSFALEGFWHAVEHYDQTRGDFNPFMHTCVNYKMNNYTDKLTQASRRPIQEESLEAMIAGRDQEEEGGQDILAALADHSWDPGVSVGEGPERIREALLKLGFPERRVKILIDRFGLGKSALAIASELGIAQKTVLIHTRDTIHAINASEPATRRLLYNE